MIEDFEPLNSVARSRQFFSGYAKCVKDTLDLTTFFSYLSKITSNLPEIYLSKSKITR